MSIDDMLWLAGLFAVANSALRFVISLVTLIRTMAHKDRVSEVALQIIRIIISAIPTILGAIGIGFLLSEKLGWSVFFVIASTVAYSILFATSKKNLERRDVLGLALSFSAALVFLGGYQGTLTLDSLDALRDAALPGVRLPENSSVAH